MRRLLLAALLGWPAAAAAQQTLCAVVQLQINQQATLEREAFSANLQISNNLPTTPLTNLQVQVSVFDSNNNNVSGEFFVTIATMTGTNAVDGTGVVQSSSTASISWLIIPSSGTGGTNPVGQRYSVTAAINALSAASQQSMTTFPAYITVTPQPVIDLQYVLPFEVFGQEPLLLPLITPIVPFPLGVRVTNVGYGPASNFQIQSAQPQVIENGLDLPLNLQIVGTEVGGQAIPNTLLIPFGNLSAGGTALGEWTMESNFSGQFTGFTSTFTHAADLGGQLTSLLQSVTTYTLLKDVLVTLPGRDAIPDFLVNEDMNRNSMQSTLDQGNQPPAEYILESDAVPPDPVVEAPGSVSGALGGANASLTYAVSGVGPNVWMHSSVLFPQGASVTVASAQRGDGEILNSRNVWISKHFIVGSKQYIYWLNLLDLTSSTNTYTITFNNANVIGPPDPVTNLSAATAPGGGAVALTWTAPTIDGYPGPMIGAEYLLEASTNPSANFSYGAAQLTQSTAAVTGASQQLTMSGLVGNATNYVRLWTADGGTQVSGLSNGATAYALPNPPALPTIASISSATITLHWQPASNAAPFDYRIAVASAMGGPIISTSPLLPATTLSYAFSGLAFNTTYYFTGTGVNPYTLAVSSPGFLGYFETRNGLLPPRTELAPGEPDYSPSASLVYATDQTTFTLEAFSDLDQVGDDEGPGIAQTDIAVDTTAFSLYAGTFSLVAEGTHTVQYYSVDLDGHVEAASTSTVDVDLTPPATVMLVGASTTPAVSGVEISSKTLVALSAADPVESGVASGVSQTFYVVDDNPFSPGCQGAPENDTQPPGTCANELYAGSFTLSLGTHTVYYLSQDNVGNQEDLNVASVTVIADTLPPRTALAEGQPSFSSSTLVYVTDVTTFSVSAVDDLAVVGDGVGLGVARTFVAVDTPAYSLYAGAFSLGDEGLHSIAYYSVDLVGNAETPHATAAAVDLTPPVTTLQSSGLSGQLPQGGAVLSTATSISLSAVDPVSNGVASGVAETFYVIDNDPFSPACLGVAEDPTQPAGTCANELYGGSFALTLGTHTVYYFSQDDVGNQEEVNVASFTANPGSGDILPPRTSLVLGEPSYSTGTIYATSVTTFGLVAVDDYFIPGDGRGVGVARTYIGVDTTTFSLYSGTFTLPEEGLDTISYYSVDLDSHVESAHAAEVGIDLTPPVTTLQAQGSSVTTASGAVIVSSFDPVALNAVDPISNGVASGVSETYYVVDQDPASQACDETPEDDTQPAGTCANELYAGPFTLSAGTHTVYYFSEDNVGNLEDEDATQVFVDTAAPITTLAVSGAPYEPAGQWAPYYSTTTRFTFISTDPVAGGFSSGVAYTVYRTNGGAFQLYQKPFALPEGVYRLDYNSEDEAGNIEVLHSTDVLLDGTPPASQAVIGTPQFTGAGGQIFITTYTPVIFSAADPALHGSTIPGSGIGSIQMSVDGGPFTSYYSSYTALTFPAGVHSILYHAVDNVGNFEQTIHPVSFQGAAPPSVQVSTSIADEGALSQQQNPTCGGQISVQVSTTPIYIFAGSDGGASCGVTATSPSGVASVQYTVNGAPVDASATGLSLPEGVDQVNVQVTDNLDQTIYETLTIDVDLTPPITTLEVLGSSATDSLGDIVVASGTSLALSAIDPISNGVASGVAETFYVVDNDPMSPACQGVPENDTQPPGTCANELYAGGPFALSLGTHTVYYFSEDNVGNQEAVNVASVAVSALATIAVSTVIVNGQPELVAAATEPIAEALVSTTSGSGASAASAAAAQGLAQVSSLYSLSSSSGAAEASVTMAYSAQQLAALGVAASSLALYQFSGSSLTLVPNQLLSQNTQTIAASSVTLPVLLAIYGASSAAASGPPNGLALAAASDGSLWAVSEAGPFSLSHYSPTGQLLAAYPIPSGSDLGGWSVQIDSQGYVYAIGTTTGTSTSSGTALGYVGPFYYGPAPSSGAIGVYRYNNQGVLVSSVSYQGGQGNLAISLDSSGNFWITGLVAVSTNPGSFSMALWKYCPPRNTLTLTAAYQRFAGGFDIGYGVKAAYGSLWVTGYSAEGPLVGGSGTFDLALWRYDPTGKTLVGGPYLQPGAILGYDLGASAKIAAAGGDLLVAANMTESGSNALAFLRYDTSGNVLSQAIVPGTPGLFPNAIPYAMALDGPNVLVAGQEIAPGSPVLAPLAQSIVPGAASENELGVWAFTRAGQYLGSVADPAHGPATAIAVSGPNVWLGLAGSTAPYLFNSTLTVSGMVNASVAQSGYRIAAAPDGSLWLVEGLAGGPASLAHYTSSGTLLSATSLTGSLSPAGVIVDTMGYAYAVAGTQGNADIAVFRVSPQGVLVSSVAFDANNAVVHPTLLDATGDLWMTGYVSTAQSFFTLAIWHYCPHNGTLTQTTTYADAAGDWELPYAIRMAPNGLWILGEQISYPSFQSYPDLLWHYDSKGQTLLGGPYLVPNVTADIAYASSFGIGTLAVSSHTLLVMTTNSSPDYGLNLARFSLGGLLLDQQELAAPAGQAFAVTDAAVDGSGNFLVAGGLVSQAAGTSQLALWRLSPELDSLGTAVAPGVSGATAVAFDGATPWLALSGSSFPYSAAGLLPGVVVSQSSADVSGRPEVVVESTEAFTVAELSSAARAGALLISTAGAQGLTAVSDVFLVSPSSGTRAPVQISFAFDPAGLSTAAVAIYHFNGVSWSSTVVMNQVLQVLPDGLDVLTGYALQTSPFGVFGYHVDLTPPVDSLSVGQASIEVSSGAIAGPATPIILTSTDPVVNGYASGVKRTWLSIDGSSFAAVVPATGTTVALSTEGWHVLRYDSEDNALNVEPVQVSSVGVDLTPPVSSLSAVGASTVTASGGLALSTSAFIALSAVDPISNGLASGVGQIYYVVDEDPASPSCDAVAASTSAPPGTCANQGYAGPFALSTGTHVVYYFAEDNVGNDEAVNFTTVTVDGLPPRTSLAVGLPRFGAAPVYVSSATPLTLRAVDDLAIVGDGQGVGVAATYLAVDSAPFALYSGTFSLPAQGLNGLQFYSVDWVGNTEVTHSSAVFLDTAPPSTALLVDGLPAATTSLTLVSTDTLSLSATDYGSGVAATLIAIDTAPWQVYVSSFSLAAGTHAVAFQSRDNVGNLEALKSAAAAVRAPVTAPPSLALTPVNGGTVTLSTPTIVAVYSDTRAAISPGSVHLVLDGVDVTTSALVTASSAAFRPASALAQGTHLISARVADVYGNVAAATSTFVVDSVPPVTSLAIGTPEFSSSTVYIATITSLGFTTSKPAKTYYTVDSATFTVFTASFTIRVEGLHQIRYYSVDPAGLTEAVQSSAVAVDATPSVTTISPDGGAITATTTVRLSAVDPVSHDVASGVQMTLYRVDGGSSAVYSAPFTLPAGGHVVTYQSEDNVDNMEAPRTALFSVQAPPVAVLLSPSPGDLGIGLVVNGEVPVLGTVASSNLKSYKMEYAFGQNATNGFVTINSGDVSVSSGTLGTWNTADISGFQTLRLVVMDQTGNLAQTQVNVFVGNPAELLMLGNREIFDQPQGVAIGGGGDIYVADTGHDRIAVFSETGGFIQAFGGSGSSIKLQQPAGVAVDDFGAIYVANTGAGQVLRLSSMGRISLTITGVKAPAGVAVDEAGDVYVADTGDKEIKKFSSGGTLLLSFALPSSAPPYGVALDQAGDIYAVDGPGGHAYKFSPAGALLMTAPIGEDNAFGEFQSGAPYGVAVSTAGDCLLVSDKKLERVVKLNMAGGQNMALGGQGLILDNQAPPSQIMFENPMGLALSAQNELFVADRDNERVEGFGLPSSYPMTVAAPFAAEITPGTSTVNGFITHKDGGSLARPDKAALLIPAEALDEDAELFISTPSARNWLEEAVKERMIARQGLIAVSSGVAFGPDDAPLASPVTVTLPYVSAQAQADGLSEMNLEVYRWNPDRQDWDWLPSSVDLYSHTVSAQTNRLSLCIVAGRRARAGH